MSQLTAIDADGHVIEKESEIRKYLKAPWNQRSTALRPGDQPWDNYMFDHFVTERTCVWPKKVIAGLTVARFTTASCWVTTYSSSSLALP